MRVLSINWKYFAASTLFAVGSAFLFLLARAIAHGFPIPYLAYRIVLTPVWIVCSAIGYEPSLDYFSAYVVVFPIQFLTAYIILVVIRYLREPKGSEDQRDRSD